jgi:hypothetical protein
VAWAVASAVERAVERGRTDAVAVAVMVLVAAMGQFFFCVIPPFSLDGCWWRWVTGVVVSLAAWAVSSAVARVRAVVVAVAVAVAIMVVVAAMAHIIHVAQCLLHWLGVGCGG